MRFEVSEPIPYYTAFGELRAKSVAFFWGLLTPLSRG